MQNYEEIMKEVDEYVSAIDLNGERIIEDCKQVIVFLKEKLVGLKEFVLSVPFSNEVLSNFCFLFTLGYFISLLVRGIFSVLLHL